jgi:hypothetical protein
MGRSQRVISQKNDIAEKEPKNCIRNIKFSFCNYQQAFLYRVVSISTDLGQSESNKMSLRDRQNQI